jgi:hypothetical protein
MPGPLLFSELSGLHPKTGRNMTVFGSISAPLESFDPLLPYSPIQFTHGFWSGKLSVKPLNTEVKMKRKCILFVTAAVLAAGSLHAAVITQTKTFGGQPNYSSILTFNQFNDMGGIYTLNSILIEVTLNTAAGASLGIDNDGQQAAAGTVEFGSNGGITASSVTLLKTDFSTFYAALVATSSKPMSLTGDNGDGSTYSTEGADYDSLVTEASSMNASANISGLVFGQYTGTGTYTITYGVNQYINMAAFGGAQFQGNPVTTDGQIKVTYDYAVPEPATASMIGLVGVLGFLIRRHFCG